MCVAQGGLSSDNGLGVIQEGEPRKPQMLNTMEWMAMSSYQCDILMMFDIKIMHSCMQRWDDRLLGGHRRSDAGADRQGRATSS